MAKCYLIPLYRFSALDLFKIERAMYVVRAVTMPCEFVDQLARELERGRTGTVLPKPVSQPMTRNFQLKAAKHVKLSN
jgi:hypothetical protein